jgi:hypothetical protein
VSCRWAGGNAGIASRSWRATCICTLSGGSCIMHWCPALAVPKRRDPHAREGPRATIRAHGDVSTLAIAERLLPQAGMSLHGTKLLNSLHGTDTEDIGVLTS